MKSARLLYRKTVFVAMAASLSIGYLPQAARGEQTSPAPAYGLLNSDLPLPDSYMTQTLKPVVTRLTGHVVLKKESAPAAAPVSTAAPAARIPTSSQTRETARTESPAPTQTPVAVAPHVVSPSPAATAPTAAQTMGGPSAWQNNHSDNFNKQLDEFIASAQQQDAELQKYVTAVQKYADWKNRFIERGRDMLNYAALFKGLSPSSEAGDVILDEKSKLKSLAAAKYLKQKLEDEIQLHAVSSVMQLAMGIGNGNTDEGKKQADEAAAELTRLAGKEQTDRIVNLLQSLQQAANQPMPQVNKPLWSVAEQKSRVDEAVASAAGNDPVVSEIKDDVHHYNQHSSSTMAVHRVARTALSLASMTPNFIGPAAQVVLFSYITVSGGTEQEKLLKELYIDKRLNSRASLLNEQAHMALYNYQVGALTRNRLLLICSQRLLSRLAGPDNASRLVSSASLGLPADQTTSPVSQ